jgi:phosphoribosylformimino-5-aminoimidazole carboxamide ribotide isomerase
MTFEILPAIDLRGGGVVRLRQGDFARETSYGAEPIDVAEAFAAAGARWLHVVDLDGARSGAASNRVVVRRIIEAVGERVRVEVAGGLRDDASVEAVLALGAARTVVGTAALRDPTFARRLVARHGADRVVVALDVRDGRAVGDGWSTEAAGEAVGEALSRLAEAGVTTFEVTAIERDGLLEGPDLALYQRLIRSTPANVIASGGIAAIEDIYAVRDAGCAGAIIGRALYEGQLDLKAALDAAAELRPGATFEEHPEEDRLEEPFIQREVTAALRDRSPERLADAFARHVNIESSRHPWDSRDEMLSLAVFFDCARRLGADPAALFGTLTTSAPTWFRETFESFAQRTDGSMSAFGWSLVDTPDGPEYRFAWPRWDPPPRR